MWAYTKGLAAVCRMCGGAYFYGFRLPYYLEPPDCGLRAEKERTAEERRKSNAAGLERGTKHFLNTITGPSPCDDCKNYNLCAEGYACWDFMHFAEYGKIRVQNRKPLEYLYRRTFSNAE